VTGGSVFAPLEEERGDESSYPTLDEIGGVGAIDTHTMPCYTPVATLCWADGNSGRGPGGAPSAQHEHVADGALMSTVCKVWT